MGKSTVNGQLCCRSPSQTQLGELETGFRSRPVLHKNYIEAVACGWLLSVMEEHNPKSDGQLGILTRCSWGTILEPPQV
jgi:hypothetical protein